MRPRLNGFATTRSSLTYAALGGCIAVCTASTGCATRAVSIRQEALINTAYIAEGEPLEVTVVCVHPDDLENQVNQPLAPGSNINSKVWYERRPTLSGSNSNPFVLAQDRIFVFTDDPEDQVWGRKLGPSLRGADQDGRSLIQTSIPFRDTFWRSGSVIYVFAAFSGPDGVIPAAPAIFPGHHRAKIAIAIGTIEGKRGNSNENHGQFIKNVEPSQR